MIMKILKSPSPILYQKAALVEKVDKSILMLVKNMTETMEHLRAQGIAAPQVGESKRIVIIGTLGANITMINPEIIWMSEHKVHGIEGCLSTNDLRSVWRADRVQVKYADEMGNNCMQTFFGRGAVCVQHEIDHLDGITIETQELWNSKTRTAVG